MTLYWWNSKVWVTSHSSRPQAKRVTKVVGADSSDGLLVCFYTCCQQLNIADLLWTHVAERGKIYEERNNTRHNFRSSNKRTPRTRSKDNITKSRCLREHLLLWSVEKRTRWRMIRECQKGLRLWSSERSKRECLDIICIILLFIDFKWGTFTAL